MCWKSIIIIQHINRWKPKRLVWIMIQCTVKIIGNNCQQQQLKQLIQMMPSINSNKMIVKRRRHQSAQQNHALLRFILTIHKRIKVVSALWSLFHYIVYHSTLLPIPYPHIIHNPNTFFVSDSQLKRFLFIPTIVFTFSTHEYVVQLFFFLHRREGYPFFPFAPCAVLPSLWFNEKKTSKSFSFLIKNPVKHWKKIFESMKCVLYVKITCCSTGKM